jgi:hypothetical protein
MNREIFPVNRETAARYHGINDFPAFPGFGFRPASLIVMAFILYSSEM